MSQEQDLGRAASYQDPRDGYTGAENQRAGQPWGSSGRIRPTRAHSLCCRGAGRGRGTNLVTCRSAPRSLLPWHRHTRTLRGPKTARTRRQGQLTGEAPPGDASQSGAGAQNDGVTGLTREGNVPGFHLDREPIYAPASKVLFLDSRPRKARPLVAPEHQPQGILQSRGGHGDPNSGEGGNKWPWKCPPGWLAPRWPSVG